MRLRSLVPAGRVGRSAGVLRSVFCALAIACAWVAGSGAAAAQDARGELGAQVTTLRLGEFDVTDVGVGVRAGWSFMPGLAVDGSLTIFPGGDAGPTVSGQQRLLAVAGVRAGVTRGRVGLSAHVRPGVLRFAQERGALCIAIFPPPLSCRVLSGYTAFATDLGGGVHVDVGPRIRLVAEAGDLMVRYSVLALRANAAVEDGFTSHNFLFNVGVGWRF